MSGKPTLRTRGRTILLNKFPNVQGSDTTDDEQSDTACYKKIPILQYVIK